MEVAAHLEIPEKHALLASDRTHNAIIRRLVQWEMARHGQETLPKHFEPGAAARYQHAPRLPKYVRSKLRKTGQAVDLILSGASKQEILGNQKITVGGSATGGRAISATLRTKFAWGQAAAQAIKQRRNLEKRLGRRLDDDSIASRTRVKPRQMVSEVQRFTAEEVAAINAHLLEGYMATLRAMPSIRRKIDQRTLF